ncbi:MAG: glycosyltransferase family 39 protein [Planctomycetes bacterium]|nr:glycosyltransferase family 39 protein [Planctomycetota bacterium]
MLVRAFSLALLVVFALLPTWLQDGFDGTEGRRVQIALEMAANDSWLVPTLGQEPTWAKPPLHYWLLRLGHAAFGDGMLALRLPSVLGAWLLAFVAGELLRRWFGARAGWIGACAIATSPLVLSQWPTAEIDPLFASLTAMSLFCLATGVARDRRFLVLAAGALGGLALLQKGPPYFVFALGAWLVWWRHRRLRGFVGYFAAMLAVAACYYVPLWTLVVRPDELLAVANEESLGRLFTYEWRHVADIPAFWVRAVAVQMPFVLWCFWEWRGARDARMDAADLTLRMCSGAAVVAIALLTLFPGRSTRYLLPNVPLFTFAVAPAVAQFVTLRGPLPRFASRAVAFVGLAGATALLVLPFVVQAPIAALGFAAACAVTPWFATSARGVVGACLLLPLAASWTVGLERAQDFGVGTRERRFAGTRFRQEMEALGVTPADLRTSGHFDSPLLLAMRWWLHGDEQARKPWQSRWVLCEVEPSRALPADYRERVRLVLPFKSFAVMERADGK